MNKEQKYARHLKVGHRVKFSDDAWAVLHNSEVDISLLSGTVVQNDFIDKVKTFSPSIWVKMDKHIPGFEEWDNSIQFTASGDGGTQIEYLFNADITIMEV
tara:strand:+ start:225 stop:527 length:303 start_codon:yes stop_codon:yes gene_type:complete